MTRSPLDGYDAKDKAMLAFMACTVAWGAWAVLKIFQEERKKNEGRVL